MSTRALVKVFDSNEKIICNIYNHSDGYCDGLGKWLYEILNGIRIVDGLGYVDEEKTGVANGMGCLAAQLVRRLKDEPGGIYLFPCDSDAAESYMYEIRKDKSDAIEHGKFKQESFGIKMKVITGDEVIFDDNIKKFENFKEPDLY